MKFRLTRLGALAFATVLGASVAGAQSPKPSPSATPAAPAAPGTPAPPAAAPPGPPQPIKLDLIPLQAPWTKVCQKDPSGTKEFCRTIRAFGQAADQPLMLAMAVDTLSSEEKKIVRIQLPEGLLIRPGFRLLIDKNEIQGQFSICASNYCFAEAEITPAQLTALKKVQVASVEGRNPGNVVVTFNVPMHDFAAAIDGPPVDPKKIEEENKTLQEQLEKKGKEQREQIEKELQPPATPAPGAAPSPKPTPAPTPSK